MYRNAFGVVRIIRVSWPSHRHGCFKTQYIDRSVIIWYYCEKLLSHLWELHAQYLTLFGEVVTWVSPESSPSQ